MAYEQRDNSGIVFGQRNNGNPRAPNFRGDVLIDGVAYECAVWQREGAKGPYMTMTFKFIDEEMRRQREANSAARKAYKETATTAATAPKGKRTNQPAPPSKSTYEQMKQAAANNFEDDQDLPFS